MEVGEEGVGKLKEEFERLAVQLREIRFPGEDELRPGERELLNPKECAVIAVDVHGAYCDPAEVLPTLMKSGTNRLQSIVPQLGEFLDSARQSGALVVLTKMKE